MPTTLKKLKKDVEEQPAPSEPRRRRRLFDEDDDSSNNNHDNTKKRKSLKGTFPISSHTEEEDSFNNQDIAIIPSTPSSGKVGISHNKQLGSSHNNNNNNNNTIEHFFSPETKRSKKSSSKVVAVVTPGIDSKIEEQEPALDDDVSNNTYIPKYLHKNVEYVRKGEAKHLLTKNIQIAYELICQHYIIPSNIEQDWTTYGPLSGTTYEERIISAYHLGKLSGVRRKGSCNDDDDVLICTACASIGHKRNDCPTLV